MNALKEQDGYVIFYDDVAEITLFNILALYSFLFLKWL